MGGWVVSINLPGGAGQLIIAKVVQIHIDKKFLDKNGDIDKILFSFQNQRLDTLDVSSMSSRWNRFMSKNLGTSMKH